jgi:hypothetical protein
MAQDGSGTASALTVRILAAQVVPRPDGGMMQKKMAKMDMKMELMLKYRRKKDERFKSGEKWHANGYVEGSCKGRNEHEIILRRKDEKKGRHQAKANGYVKKSAKGRNGNGSF